MGSGAEPCLLGDPGALLSVKDGVGLLPAPLPAGGGAAWPRPRGPAPILDRFLLNVLDRAWHVKCVQCCECKCNLTEKCFSREGKLYCKNDFFR